MQPSPQSTLNRWEAFATGFSLSHLQVALGFIALRGTGASALHYFALLLLWLLGGCTAVIAQKRRPRNLEGPLLSSALSCLIAAEVVATFVPFRIYGLLFVLASTCLGGAYGGAFLADRAARSARISALFLHENNGFLLGFISASVILLLRSPLLVPVAVLLALYARYGHAMDRFSASTHAFFIALVAIVMQLLLPGRSMHAWDGLMTASVLTHWHNVSLREVLFFAHPLVIPLSWPFAHFSDDPLRPAALREAVCSGGVLALAYLGGRAVARSSVVGLIAALGMLLAVGRWQLAAAGEEKEIALFFGGAFYFLYLDHREIWNLELTHFRALDRLWRRLILGALLALATATHLVNGVLVLCVIADVLLDRARRPAISEAAWVLGIAALIAAPFFIYMAVGPGEARSVSAVVRYYLEYHLSGEFVSVPASLGERLFDAYRGARTWLLGELPLSRPRTELIAAFFITAALTTRALRFAPRPITRLAVWILVLTAHFFFYDPWHPEAWGPAGLGWAVILAVGLAAPGRLWRARLGIAALCLCALTIAQLHNQLQARRERAAIARFTEAESHLAAPLGDLISWVDAIVEPDAVIVVNDRLLASYFHIYTTRPVVVRSYLDHTPQELRQSFHLTTLSLRFYTPAFSSQSLTAAALSGRALYLLDNSEDRPGALALPWLGLQLSRIEVPQTTP